MQQTYTPISCSYYDLLESLAVRRIRSEIVYVCPEGDTALTTFATIIDVYARGDEEFIKLDTKEAIRLDRIVSINGEANPTDNCQLPTDN